VPGAFSGGTEKIIAVGRCQVADRPSFLPPAFQDQPVFLDRGCRLDQERDGALALIARIASSYGVMNLSPKAMEFARTAFFQG